jgi:cellulose synthase/poly-beta-1,6-N-acetylglucosamine synthase-like glycosyltransferase
MSNISFSIVIVTYNRPTQLAQCLNSFFHLDYPAEKWELIVVNDGGEHSFSQITDDLHRRLPLKLLTVAHRGPATARNAGAADAQGQFLVFLDDDCVIEPDWLKSYELGFQELSADALGGQTINPYPNNVPAATWQAYIDFLRLKYFVDGQGNTLLLPANNIAYRRKTFAELEGFDESFPLAAAEDNELGFRLVSQGYRQEFYPRAKVSHNHRNSYWGYIKQQFRYGRGAYYFWQATYRKNTRLLKRWRLSKYYWRLGNWLWNIRGPLPMWILMSLSPAIHGLGFFYEYALRPQDKQID